MAIIQELENKQKSPHYWSDDEIDTLQRYYGKFPLKEILPYLNNRSNCNVRQKAKSLGLTIKKVLLNP
jgi:hypothetical protein